MLTTLWRELCLAKIALVNAPKDDQTETSKRAIDGGANSVIIEPVLVNTLETVLQKAGIY